MKYLTLLFWMLLVRAALADGVPERKPGFVWHADTARMDARIENWPLSTTLSRLARVTGWQIYCEPGNDRRITTAFSGLPLGEALPRILGNLSFNLPPTTNGVPKLYVYRTDADAATEAIVSAKDQEPGIIGNELIVALKPGSKLSMEELAAKLGGKITGHSDDLNAWRLTFPTVEAAEAAKKLLAAEEGVASVENNLRFAGPDQQRQFAAQAPGGIDLKPKVVGDKDRIIIGLIDTAVQPSGSKYDAFLWPSVSVMDGKSTSTEISHGTAMMETILKGVSMVETRSDFTAVRILPVDVYGANESTTSWDVARGINAALAGGATIINMSLGSPEQSPWLQIQIANATKQGALFIGSAGNSPVTTPMYPAAYPEVLAVTAGNRGQLAPYANRGQFIDVMAPGSSYVQYGGVNYVVSGTSPAAAYVSGIAGALRGLPGYTPEAIRAKIENQLGYRPGK